MVEPSTPGEKTKDFSTAILNKKKAPHKLQVEESKQDDNSIVEMTQAKMDELKIFKGDAVILKGKKRRETVCIALTTEEEGAEDGHVLMNKVVRRNLRVRMGDTVSVHPCPNDVPNATKIHVLPYADSVEGITGNIT
jgi:transitional endoplasmic reticulum ATPase